MTADPQRPTREGIRARWIALGFPSKAAKILSKLEMKARVRLFKKIGPLAWSAGVHAVGFEGGIPNLVFDLPSDPEIDSKIEAVPRGELRAYRI